LLETMGFKGWLCALTALFLFGCATTDKHERRDLPPRISSTPVEGMKSPEEPFLNLAWRAAVQVEAGLQQASLPLQLKMLQLENSADIPPDAAAYFQAALMTRLQTFGIIMPGDAGVQLRGSLYWLRDQLVYGLKLYKDDHLVFSDSVSIARNERLENTLAQFRADTGHHHHETSIPTPVAQLQQAPLDVSQLCLSKGEPCNIILLYRDHFEILNWKTLAVKNRKIPPGFLSATISRAPSGKIVQTAAGRQDLFF
jgi:hypothetical protein